MSAIFQFAVDIVTAVFAVALLLGIAGIGIFVVIALFAPFDKPVRWFGRDRQ